MNSLNKGTLSVYSPVFHERGKSGIFLPKGGNFILTPEEYFQDTEDIPIEWCDDPDDMEGWPAVISGMITHPSLTLLYGEPKVGKTYMGLHMAVAMAAGLPWMGLQTMESVSGNIGVLSLDMGKRGIKHHLDQVIAGYGTDYGLAKSDLRGLARVSAESFRLIGKPAANFGCWCSMNLLGRFIWKNRIKMLLVDTFSKATQGSDENFAREMVSVMTPIRSLAEFLDCSIMFIHHSDKAGIGIRGSSVLAAEFDQVIVMRNDKYSRDRIRVDVEKSRYTENRIFYVRRTMTDRLGPDGQVLLDSLGHPLLACHFYQCEEREADEAPVPKGEQERQNRDMQVILSIIRETPGIGRNEIIRNFCKRSGDGRTLSRGRADVLISRLVGKTNPHGRPMIRIVQEGRTNACYCLEDKPDSTDTREAENGC